MKSPKDTEKEFEELFSTLEVQQPSARFTKNVLEAIDGLQVVPASKRYVNPLVVKGIAAILLAEVFLACSYFYINADSLAVYTYTLKNNEIRLLNKITNHYSTYIILANAVVSLLFIERLITGKRRISDLQRHNISAS